MLFPSKNLLLLLHLKGAHKRVLKARAEYLARTKEELELLGELRLAFLALFALVKDFF